MGQTPDGSEGLAFKGTVVALRFGNNDDFLFQRVAALAELHGLSMNMAVKMLLGYAFNEIDVTGKSFVPKVVFESE